MLTLCSLCGFQVDYALEAVAKGTAAVSRPSAPSPARALSSHSRPCILTSVCRVFRSESSRRRVLCWVSRRRLPCSCRIRGRSGRWPCSTTTSVSPSPVSPPPSLSQPLSRHSLIAGSYICALIGLTADGRIIIDKGRVECQSHRLTVEDPVSVEFITRYIAAHKQVRPPCSPHLLISPRH